MSEELLAFFTQNDAALTPAQSAIKTKQISITDADLLPEIQASAKTGPRRQLRDGLPRNFC
jgi:hypothetical protein